MIQFQDVSKSYNNGEVQAVKNLSLTVASGELFGFLGPNGAGKTTTIKIMTGLLKPDSGTILLNGMDIKRKPLQAKRIIGYVPDEPVFYEKMTGIQFLTFIADVFDMPQEYRRNLPELAEKFEMDTALADVVSSYSHGMRQKLAILAALIHNPKILILDEPIVGLDPKASFMLKETLRSLCGEGKTVFFSTHVMEVAEKLCDRVGIISRGELIAAAPLKELRAEAGEKNASLEKLFLEITGSLKEAGQNYEL
ncbi:MAG: ABC transporter ATP-binding protein [Spirochaetales bacterium]|nr:ABC transporter ATP-binding protein [Spirochaetales bacterium]RKX82113.1 MAG: ABC transporter ATP-binding protein [Spirochaetota bacterium]